MKVLIADDEYHVIEAIRLLVPWNELGIDRVFIASSVAESKVIIKNETPEIVIMDIIMTDQTGIDLMHFINSEYPATKSIAISGHSNFEYVRTMLTCGSIDYLLKPLEADVLIRAVSHAIDAWNNDHKKSLDDMRMRHQINFFSVQHSNTLLSKMLKEEPFEDSYRVLTQIDPRFASIHTCTLLFYDINYFPMEHSGFTEILDQFEDEVQNHFTMYQTGSFFYSLNNPNEVVLFLYETAEGTLQHIRRTVSGLFRNQIFPFHLGCSSSLSFPGEYRASFLQAKQAFFAVNSLQVPEYIVSCNTDCIQSQPIPESDLENQMLSALLTGSQARIENAASQWLAALLPDDVIPLYIVQNICNLFQESLMQWTALLKKWLPNFTHDSSGCGFTYHQLLDDKYLFSPDLLKAAIVSDIRYLFDELRHISSTDVFHKIAYHMELNYRQNFSQAELARLFYLNKDYMCRKFKKIFNVSMVSYLNQIRIEHGKKLIRNTSLRLRDIAYQVGFDDEKYFTRQFKKLTTVTPSEYRDLLDQDALQPNKKQD